MQDKPYLTSQTSLSPYESTSVRQETRKHVPQPYSQKLDRHSLASSQSFLLSIPAESLTHITSFVADPPSLFALSRVNRHLRDHIADDNTWYRAFVFHFLHVGPESEAETEEMLMLRRSESTWMKEYVKRFNLVRRWERSRSATLNYQPHYWGISSMHLLENLSLLTANLQYGIVTRSFPLTGKILKGHLDASGTRNGFGIGNPNEEFSPNVACIALSSCGGTGRIAWGFRNGEAAVTSAPRVMDSNRSAARYARCRVEDEHAGEVLCLAFAGRDDELLVTGCNRGQVKIWEARRMQCLWTGFEKNADPVVPAACVKVDFNFRTGVLVAAFTDGVIMVWWGLDGEPFANAIHELRIEEELLSKDSTVNTLLQDPTSSPSRAVILVHRAHDRHFFRLVVDLPSGLVHRTLFGDGPLGPLTSLKACFYAQIAKPFASTPDPPASINGSTPSLAITLPNDMLGHQEPSFILGGDSLGNVCVWNWDAVGSFAAVDSDAESHANDAIAQVNSSRKWEAHQDGAICAIEVHGAVIVTGSTCGTLKVWDSLTLTMLRAFSSPTYKVSVTGERERVGQIVVRGDILIASVGSRVLVWRAAALAQDKKGKRKSAGKPKGRATGNSFNKWQQQMELNSDIRESQRLLEDERVHSQRVHGREREQLSVLDQLGLSEREAVEYMLMLSREEEEQRLASNMDNSSAASTSGEVEEGATSLANDENIEGVFSLDDSPGLIPSAQSSTPTLFGTSESTSSSPRSLPRFILSHSNSKVQVSPPFLPEPTEAGVSTSPPRLPAFAAPVATLGPRSAGISPSTSLLSSSTDAHHFPAISPSSSTPSRCGSSPRLAGLWTRGSPCGSVGSMSAQSDQLSSSTPSTGGSPSASAHGPGDGIGMGEVEEDAVLKYVLELSLAEARSRGEA